MKSSFQDGVDAIYNAIVAQGTTPGGKSPADLVSAIKNTGNFPDELFAISGNSSGDAAWSYVTVINPKPEKYHQVRYQASSSNNSNVQVRINNVMVNGSGYLWIGNSNVTVSARTDNTDSQQPSWSVWWHT